MTKPNIAIIQSTFRAHIGDALLSECLKQLKKDGVKESQISIFKVPGALEIPLVAKKLAKQKSAQGGPASGGQLEG